MRVLNAAILVLEVFGLAIGYFPEPSVPKTVVVSLADSGPGTLREAVESGCFCVVFDCSGTIRLKSTLVIEHPVGIYGGTSPGGITLVCSKEMRGPAVEICGDNVYLSHLRIRPGAGLPSHKSRDGILVHDSIGTTLDHLSVAWATDENLDVWRGVKRFVCRDCLIAEGLAFPRDDYLVSGHSCGMRIGPDADVDLRRVVFIHNNSRSPLIAGGSRVTLSNVISVNCGSQCVGIGGKEGSGPIHLAAGGCVMITGKNTKKNLPMWELGDPTARVFTRHCLRDGKASNLVTPEVPDVMVSGYWYHQDPAVIAKAVLKDVGARPWDRDTTDARLVSEVLSGKGGRIKHESEREGLGLTWDAVEEPESVRR